jgi:hypothetical protein
MVCWESRSLKDFQCRKQRNRFAICRVLHYESDTSVRTLLAPAAAAAVSLSPLFLLAFDSAGVTFALKGDLRRTGHGVQSIGSLSL